MSQTKDTNDASLDAVLGQESETVKVGDEDIVVTPIKFGKLPAVLKHIGALVVDAQGKINYGATFMTGGEEVIQCLAVVLDKPREWFDTIGSVDGIKLLAAAVRVNRDLFEKKVAPEIQRLVGKISSPNSSQPATASTTSGITPSAK